MRYVAFLRGMNLGGRRIKNPDLCAAFEAIGFTQVQAFLASGNVVFDAKADAGAVKQTLEAGLAEHLGYAVPSMIFTADAVRAIAAHQPFPDRPAVPRGKQQVMFMDAEPVGDAAGKVMALSTADDWLEIGARVIYWWPKGGLSQSDFDSKALEKITGTVTVRTKNTVERLAKKFLQ